MGAPWATCTVESCTGVRLAGRYYCLAHADRHARHDAFTHIAGDAEIDLRGLNLDRDLLDEVLRAVPSDERERTRWSSVRLDGAVIGPGPPLDLTGHEFTGAASWREVVVRRPVILREARFELADFREADFAEHVDAAGALFGGVPRFDDARFRAGLRVDDAWFDGGFDLRRVVAPEVLMARATVHGSADVSLASIGTLDVGGARISGDLILDGVRVDRVVLTETTVDGTIRAGRAEVGRWEPAFGVVAAEVEEPGIGPAAQQMAPWRPDLLAGAAPEGYHWVALEEWVGHTDAAGDAGYRGGIIGLQVDGWPRVDGDGKPAFDPDAVRSLAVHADALTEVLAELLGERFTPLRVGDVYALRLTAQVPDDETPMGTAELRLLGPVDALDISTEARDAAKAAFWSVLVPPLDAEADATLVSALRSAAEDDR